MASIHPTGITVDVVGTNSADRGRSCEEHTCCGKEILKEDVVVRFREVQVLIDGNEETAIAAYWVSDGVDRCRVGFLPRHCLKHKAKYVGKLAQITDVYDEDSDSPTKKRLFHRNHGCCRAAIISSPSSTDVQQPAASKRRRLNESKETNSDSDSTNDKVED